MRKRIWISSLRVTAIEGNGLIDLWDVGLEGCRLGSLLGLLQGYFISSRALELGSNEVDISLHVAYVTMQCVRVNSQNSNAIQYIYRVSSGVQPIWERGKETIGSSIFCYFCLILICDLYASINSWLQSQKPGPEKTQYIQLNACAPASCFATLSTAHNKPPFILLPRKIE